MPTPTTKSMTDEITWPTDEIRDNPALLRMVTLEQFKSAKPL